MNAELLLKLVGTAKFVPVATVSMRALQENFTADIVGAVVRTDQTGTRKLMMLPAEKKRKAG